MTQITVRSVVRSMGGRSKAARDCAGAKRHVLMATGLSLLLCTLVGCVLPYPHRTLRSAEVRGRVLDARTHEPIQGAKVFFSKHPQLSALTDVAGCFRIPATHSFHLLAFAPEGHWPADKYWSPEITISDEGYVPHSFHNESPYKGDVLLERTRE